MYQLCPSSFEENQAYFKAYLESLSNVYDNFLEDLILTSQVYSILIDGVHAGYLAVHGGDSLTQFFLTDRYLGAAQEVFEMAHQELHFSRAFVPTCDELLVSLCAERQARFDMQAYYFTDCGVPSAGPQFPRTLLRLADRSEWKRLVEDTEGVLHLPLQEKFKDSHYVYELYVMEQNGETLGYGLRESNRIFTEHNGVSVYTLPEHRRKGVGRSIILHLRDICYENGKKPLPGCWYYNERSKLTLSSAGFVSKSRLLKILF